LTLGPDGDFLADGLLVGCTDLTFQASPLAHPTFLPYRLSGVPVQTAEDNVVEVLFAEGAVVRGRVTAQAGESVADAPVLALPVGEDALRNAADVRSRARQVRDRPPDFAAAATFTAADGTYELPPLLPGRYFLYAAPPGDSDEPSWGGQHLSGMDAPTEPMTRQLIRLEAAGPHPVDLAFRQPLRMGGTLAGTIYGLDGEPLRLRCLDYVLRRLPGPDYSSYGYGSLAVLRTDAQGGYRFTDLPPGTYTLKVMSPDWPTVRREGITVAAAAGQPPVTAAAGQPPNRVRVTRWRRSTRRATTLSPACRPEDTPSRSAGGASGGWKQKWPWTRLGRESR
jgi:protocatechuate 3,4-dioxygenase beta subunit